MYYIILELKMFTDKEIRQANVLPTLYQNADTICNMVETKISYPTSQSDRGNVRPRKGKAYKETSPRSKNGKVKHLHMFDIGNGQSILLEMK